MKLHTKILALATLAASLTVSVKAISYSAGLDGTTAPGAASFTGYYNGNPASLATKSQGGWTILGVAGGTSGTEIGPKESLHVEFNKALKLTDLQLGLLFNGDEYNDHFEIAVVQADGDLATYKLTAIGDDVATWTGAGSVSNLSKAIKGKGAVWEITNPFGSELITGFWLFPDQANVRKGDNAADFGLTAFKAPDAASTIAVFGFALLGLAAFRRRK